MSLMARGLQAAAPVAVIAAAFAAAVGHHLGEPGRQARRFSAQLAAAAPAAAAVPDTDFIVLGRGTCHAGCPAYDVRLDAAGRVEFVGLVGTCAARPAPRLVDAAATRRLLQASVDSGLLIHTALPRRPSDDDGLATLLLRHGTDVRRLTFAPGDPAEALPAAVARAVDATAGVARWLPAADAAGRLACPAEVPGR